MSDAAKPVFYYDGDCRFCVSWVHYWKHLTFDRVSYVPQNEIPAATLVVGATTTTGAKAIFGLLTLAGKKWWLWLYEKMPGFGAVSELSYRLIARYRGFFYRVTRLFWGKDIRPARFFIARALFFKILALIYLVAFISFGSQAAGLVGSKGILPAVNYLEAAKTQLSGAYFLRVPTVFWLDASDAAFTVVTLLGIVFAILLLFGLLPRTSLITLFILYLSFVSVGQVFMQFQWDVLLLEAGFLAILVSFSTGVVWLFRWLIFRLMFMSGAVKLLSQDPSWKNLTALNYHFETQPLPTIFGWFAHHLPGAFHRLSVGGMFFIELAVPFFVFLPRHFRIFAAASIVFLEGAIFLTGNYTFLNILTIALCLFLLDDALLQKVTPKKILTAITAVPNRRMPIFGRSLIAVFVVLIFFVSFAQMTTGLFGWFPKTGNLIASLVSQFHIANNYGLFAVMTTQRNEIIIEGSRDGREWLNYELPYKPGDLKRVPSWVQPFQPRLDWQLWFAALGNFNQSPWFARLMERVLQGSEPVLKLFSKNPFPESPPSFARALIYKYQFTTPEERRVTGDWWRREQLGLYFPEVFLQNSGR